MPAREKIRLGEHGHVPGVGGRQAHGRGPRGHFLAVARRELVARHGERVFRLFQIYLWAGAHRHRDGGLEADRAAFQKPRDLPSPAIGVGGGFSTTR